MLFGGAAAVLIFSVVREKRKQTFSRAYARARDRATAARRKRRREEVDRTALVAAEDDPAFAADRVRTEAQELFTQIQEAWDRDDREALAARVAPDLMAEWRLTPGGLRVQGLAQPRGRAVERGRVRGHHQPPRGHRGPLRRAGLGDARRLRPDRGGERINHTGNTSGETHLREYWTLGKRDGRWTLLSIEQDEEGEHQLEAPMEADPAEDARLTDRARVEAAVVDALPEGVHPSEVDDDDAESALQKARDMSLNDQRFDPDIIEARPARRGRLGGGGRRRRRRVRAPRPARPAAGAALPASPGRDLRLVVRAPVVRRVTFVDLDTEATPATVTVHMELEGVRYVEDRNTLTLVAGSKDRATRFDGTWTLALDGSPDVPWRIAAVRDDPPPAEAPPSSAATTG